MRADKFFADKFGSRTKAAQAIENGLVLINGKTIKAKDEIKDSDEISYITAKENFVSNGGFKLSRAIHHFDYDCQDKIFADIGASTGGFTDCLLQNGAKKVYAIDVGESLLDVSLADNQQIVRMENTNARYLEKDAFIDDLDCVVTDVSFISLRLILPTIARILKENGDAFVLIKPQFECEKKIGKSGIVKTELHAGIVTKVLGFAQENGLYPFGIVNAPVRKGKNIEYVLYLKNTAYYSKSQKEIVETVQNFLKSAESKQFETT